MSEGFIGPKEFGVVMRKITATPYFWDMESAGVLKDIVKDLFKRPVNYENLGAREWNSVMCHRRFPEMMNDRMFSLVFFGIVEELKLNAGLPPNTNVITVKQNNGEIDSDRYPVNFDDDGDGITLTVQLPPIREETIRFKTTGKNSGILTARESDDTGKIRMHIGCAGAEELDFSRVEVTHKNGVVQIKVRRAPT